MFSLFVGSKKNKSLLKEIEQLKRHLAVEQQTVMQQTVMQAIDNEVHCRSYAEGLKKQLDCAQQALIDLHIDLIKLRAENQALKALGGQ